MNNKYLMPRLNDFINESSSKPHNEITNIDRLNNIIEDFGINPDEIYYDSIKDGIYRMAEEIYYYRGRKYVDSGWVNPN